jgi:hypothetical protein
MKNMINRLVVAIVLVVTVSSCQPPQMKLRDAIANAEAQITSDSLGEIPVAKGDSLVNMYIGYTDEYKDDTLCADYFFRAAEVSMKIGKPSHAVDFYGRIQRFPNYRKTARALFMQGFVSENNLHDLEAAKGYYHKFLIQYPNHALAGDVKIMLENIGLTPEQLMQRFQANTSMPDSLAQTK